MTCDCGGVTALLDTLSHTGKGTNHPGAFSAHHNQVCLGEFIRLNFKRVKNCVFFLCVGLKASFITSTLCCSCNTGRFLQRLSSCSRFTAPHFSCSIWFLSLLRIAAARIITVKRERDHRKKQILRCIAIQKTQ